MIYNKTMKRIASFITGLFLALTLVFASPTTAQAQLPTAWTEADGCVSDGVATIQGAQCLISNVFAVAITFIGLAAFVMLIVGSFGYMLSGGNTKGTETARNTITFAIVGIVVALSAFIILNLIKNFTGVEEVTQFEIPGSDTDFTQP
jgi:hypothetical protein